MNQFSSHRPQEQADRLRGWLLCEDASWRAGRCSLLIEISGIPACSNPSPFESRSFVLRFSSQEHPCEKGRSEDQRKRNPGPQEAGKHLQPSGNQERHDKEIHRDHTADKHDRRLEWRGVMEPLEVDQRHKYKEDGGKRSMDGECCLQR